MGCHDGVRLAGYKRPRENFLKSEATAETVERCTGGQPAAGFMGIDSKETTMPIMFRLYIRRGTHRSTRQLEQAIRHYIRINNDDPKPFVWSKTADDIPASVERFCLRTSNSRH